MISKTAETAIKTFLEEKRAQQVIDNFEKVLLLSDKNKEKMGTDKLFFVSVLLPIQLKIEKYVAQRQEKDDIDLLEKVLFESPAEIKKRRQSPSTARRGRKRIIATTRHHRQRKRKTYGGRYIYYLHEYNDVTYLCMLVFWVYCKILFRVNRFPEIPFLFYIPRLQHQRQHGLSFRWNVFRMVH